MDTLSLKIGMTLAFFAGVVLVGINMTEICGHVAGMVISGGVFVGSFIYRTERCAKKGVVINPNQQKTWEEGLKTLALVIMIGMLVFPNIIPVIFWLGIGHCALCAALY